jgi:hypothetical protein
LVSIFLCGAYGALRTWQHRQRPAALISLFFLPECPISMQFPVATDIKEVLAGTDTRFSDILRMVNLYERADSDRSEELAGVLGIERSSIPGAYLQAMHLAHEIHKLA